LATGGLGTVLKTRIVNSSNNIAVIDLDSVAYSAGSPVKVLDPDGNPVKGPDNKNVYREQPPEELDASVDTVMESILAACGATSYAAFIKGKASAAGYRKTVNPSYKANRSKESPQWWPRVKDRFVSKWGAVEVSDGVEVDDYVNATRLSIEGSFAVAIDKDLLGLEGTHYNWKKQEWVTVESYAAAYYFWHDMVAGQAGDNIKGIPGKGTAYVRDRMGLLEPTQFRKAVLEEYCQHFGEAFGIEQFYKNYTCLKILETFTDIQRLTLKQPLTPIFLPCTTNQNQTLS